MRPLFRPALVNDPYGDPALFVDCLFERRALLFDLGNILALPPRKILRITDVFVSHAHMDHFMGFDWLLRIGLGRDRTVSLFGPAAFVAQVEHKLAAYTWNLVTSYETDFTVLATELLPGGTARRAAFHCREAFRRRHDEDFCIPDGIIHDSPLFRVHAAILDHGTPCLGYLLEEKRHVNIWKDRLDELGLPVGPWLRELKQAILRDEPEDAPFRAWWREGEHIRSQMRPLGDFKNRLAHIVSGERIGYVTDIAFHEDNVRRLDALLRGADRLFIETCFLDEDAARAKEKRHLTARQAGWIAARVHARQVIPFHISPLYRGREDALRAELATAFRSSGGAS